MSHFRARALGNLIIYHQFLVSNKSAINHLSRSLFSPSILTPRLENSGRCDRMASSGNKSSEEPGKDASDNYILVDIGANLTNKKFSRDVDSVVQRAKEVGVQKIMVTGSNVSVSKEALRLTRLFPDVLYSTAGTCVLLNSSYMVPYAFPYF